MTKLSDTALVLLGKAATRDDRLAEPPNHLPAAARNAVERNLLKRGLLEEVPNGLPSQPAWREDDDGRRHALRITDAGFRALNMDPPGNESEADTSVTDAPTAPDTASVQAEGLAVAAGKEAAQGAPVSAPRASLRDVAAAVLNAWDARETSQDGLPDAIDRLRLAVATKPGRSARQPGAPRKPREGTKQQAVLALLGRAEGATIAQVMDATAWAPHTVRGFLAGLKKKGHTIEVLDRVRMVGPNKEGAKGSYSIYRVTTPSAG